MGRKYAQMIAEGKAGALRLTAVVCRSAGAQQWAKDTLPDTVRVCPSAEALYQLLQKEHPDISLATVYRNLALFKSQGLAVSVGTVDGIERFDGNTEPHVHFICTDCGAVQDLFQVEQPDYSGFERSLGCRVDSTQLTLTGLCRDCLEASQAKSS